MAVPHLLLLHPPSQLDFRERPYRHWMLGNTVATSPVFEYYPLGFLTLMEYLERHGRSVRIVNMAVKMTKDRRFDPAKFLRKQRPLAFGIDLHWAPHTPGALELAAVCKQVHPEIPVVLGGLTASYFHEEAIRDPNVDFVLRGDSTEAPALQLLECLEAKRAPGEVPNLTWKENGEVRVNPLTYQPNELDIKVDFGLLRKHMLRYLDLRGNLLTGYQWPAYCFNMLLWCRGCKYRCVTCGGNNWSLGREKLAVRDPGRDGPGDRGDAILHPPSRGDSGRRANGRLAITLQRAERKTPASRAWAGVVHDRGRGVPERGARAGAEAGDFPFAGKPRRDRPPGLWAPLHQRGPGAERRILPPRRRDRAALLHGGPARNRPPSRCVRRWTIAGASSIASPPIRRTSI